MKFPGHGTPLSQGDLKHYHFPVASAGRPATHLAFVAGTARDRTFVRAFAAR
jgi:hypothetical protein